MQPLLCKRGSTDGAPPQGDPMTRLNLRILALRLTRGALLLLVKILTGQINGARDQRAWLLKRRKSNASKSTKPVTAEVQS
jgi:hypothetical protein